MALKQRRNKELGDLVDRIRAESAEKLAELEARIAELESEIDYKALVDSVGGIPKHVAEILIEAGYDTVEKVRAASDEDLLGISGIGEGRVKAIRALL